MHAAAALGNCVRNSGSRYLRPRRLRLTRSLARCSFASVSISVLRRLSVTELRRHRSRILSRWTTELSKRRVELVNDLARVVLKLAFPSCVGNCDNSVAVLQASTGTRMFLSDCSPIADRPDRKDDRLADFAARQFIRSDPGNVCRIACICIHRSVRL